MACQKLGDNIKKKWTIQKTTLRKHIEDTMSVKDKEAVDKLFKGLDENGDSEVDFNEFVIFVAAMTCCCHKYFEQKGPK
nr:protein S100-P isoform X2 [Caretta caretta]